MATPKQRGAARRNVGHAIAAAKRKRSIAGMPKSTRSALGRQAAAVRQRNRRGGTTPRTRAELYEMAKRRNVRGRSRMSRAELARAVGER